MQCGKNFAKSIHTGTERFTLTQSKLEGLLSKAPKNISQGARTEFAQAMLTTVNVTMSEAYRFYYINEKKGFAKWTKRNVPYWWYKG